MSSITPDTGMTPEPRKSLRKRTWFRVTCALIAVAVIGGVAAGAAGGQAKPAAAAPPTASSVPAAPAQQATPPTTQQPATGTADGSLLACGTVVDTDLSMSGFKSATGSLTEVQVISYLQAMLLADGIRNIPIGTPSSQDAAILSGAQLDLENYNGDKLADDSEQFAQDEQGYNASGPIDTTYAKALISDINTLVRDCPSSLKMALHVLHQA
jgi:hypothetical protein